MTPRLLRAEEGRLSEALRVIQVAFAEHDGSVDPPSSMHRLTLTDLEAPGKEVWSLGPEPRAVVVLTPQSGALYLGKLAVLPEYRGHGLSRILVEHAAKRAMQLGLSYLVLETRIELIDNHAAFAKMGFVKITETAHPGYGRPTSIKMQRALS